MNPQHEMDQEEKRLKELRKRRDDHTISQAEKRELEELEGKEEKHASGKNLKETPAEKKAREEREKNETKEEKEARLAQEKADEEAEKKEAERLAREKRWKDGEPTEDDIEYERVSLLKEAHQILVDHVTRLGGVGAPMGPLGERFMAWLDRWNKMAVVAPVETDEEKKAREEAENEGHPKIPKKELDRLDKEEEEREKEKEPKPFKFK